MQVAENVDPLAGWEGPGLDVVVVDPCLARVDHLERVPHVASQLQTETDSRQVICRLIHVNTRYSYVHCIGHE